jgi:SAM-dependent methyltransferase
MDKQLEIWEKRYARHTAGQTGADGWIKRYEGYLREKKDTYIVDLGCGTGVNSFYLHGNGFKVIACDFSPRAVRMVNEKNPGIETMCFDMAEGIPIYGKRVGAVVASLSTHYFTLDDTVRLYRNIHGLLERDGYFIFRVNGVNEYLINDIHNAEDEIEENYYRLKNGSVKRYFGVSDMRGFLEGFEVIQVEDCTDTYFGKTKYFIGGIAVKK